MKVMRAHVTVLSRLVRGLRSALLAGVLMGCPQLLEDEFELKDGSAPLSNGGGAGDTSGASGTSSIGGSAASGASNTGSDPDDTGILDPAESDGVGGQGGDGAASGGAGGAGGQGGSSEPAPDALGALEAAIVHRYSFDGEGTTLVDSVGSKDGTFVGGTLTGDGRMVLSGSGEYGDLPNHLISVYSSVTLEAWVIWSGSSDHQRIFDFGVSSTGVEDEQGSNGSHVYLTPKAPGVPGNMVLSYRAAGTLSLNTTALVSDDIQHVAVVIDGSAHTMAIYRNGVLAAFRDQSHQLSQIEDVNSWLGRSQIGDDPDFEGEFREFRIYETALDADAILFSYDAGEDVDMNTD
jgi:hypothetical protein